MNKLLQTLIVLILAFNLASCASMSIPDIVSNSFILTDGQGSYWGFFRTSEAIYHYGIKAGKFEYFSTTQVKEAQIFLETLVSAGWYHVRSAEIPVTVINAVTDSIARQPVYLNMPLIILPVTPDMLRPVIPAPVQVNG